MCLISAKPSARVLSQQSSPRVSKQSSLLAEKTSGGRARCRAPRWVLDWRTWVTIFVVVGVLALGLWRMHVNEKGKQEHFRLEVGSVAQWYRTALVGQLRSSVSSLHALAALLKVDDKNLTMDNFASIAGLLMETLRGITNLQLAPAGTIQKIHPLVDERQDNRKAIGHALLLDPRRKDVALATIRSDSVRIAGPLKLLQGGVGILGRYAIFTSFAPEFLPDESWSREGITYSSICSDPTQRDAGECSFPGPIENGKQTYFWGFATLLTLVADLLRPLELERLEREMTLSRPVSFHYQLRDTTPHLSIQSTRGIFAHSTGAGPEVVQDRPVLVNVSLPEIGVEWELSLSPWGGWPTVSSDFWIQLALLLLVTGLMGAAACFMIIGNVRGKYQRLKRLEDYKIQRTYNFVEGCVEDLDRVRFPMCVMALSVFEELGGLITHEEARDRGLLIFRDTVEAMLMYAMHTVFMSHQWAGFSHPDASGVQYSSMLHACRVSNQASGSSIQWVWVDYFSIPQANHDQQQAAIDSLAVYAAHSATFVAVTPSCQHAELGTELNSTSYFGRAWCRLEQLAYLTANSHLPSMPAFLLGSDGLRPLFDEPSDADGLKHNNPWQTALEVIKGDFSCCARGHSDGMPCDKERIVSVMLGTLWRLKRAAMQHPGKTSRVDTLLTLMETDSERYFPSTFLYTSTDNQGKVCREEIRELFSDKFTVLQELFEVGPDCSMCEESLPAIAPIGIDDIISRL